MHIEVMQRNHNLKKLLTSIKQKYGGDLATPKNFLCLSLDINDKCGENLSVATIKRVFGYVRYENNPSTRTLNTLADYIGYRNYAEFCEMNMEPSDSVLFICGLHIDIGDIVEVFFPQMEGILKLQYKGNYTFRLLQ